MATPKEELTIALTDMIKSGRVNEMVEDLVSNTRWYYLMDFVSEAIFGAVSAYVLYLVWKLFCRFKEKTPFSDLSKTDSRDGKEQYEGWLAAGRYVVYILGIFFLGWFAFDAFIDMCNLLPKFISPMSSLII